MYEREQEGVLYNTAAVIDADGSYLGKYRKTHIPHVQGVLGEVLLPARQPRLPGLRHRGRPGRRLHLLRPALPRGLARARPQRRADRVQPVGDQPRPVEYLWELEQPAAAVANEYFVGAINRVGRRAARRRRLLRLDLLRRPAWPARRRGGERQGRGARRSATSTSTSSPRSATAGSSTATAVPTRTAR